MHSDCRDQPARVPLALPSGSRAPLLISVYGLTEREEEVTRLVLQGNSTAEIGERPVVSAHTVQQHLKNIFDKTGVRSRCDLVGKVFFAHYELRLRDNEHRAAHGQPLRGRPLDTRGSNGRSARTALPATH
jgi:DNA-binding CsgD family transcriptional regulator